MNQQIKDRLGVIETSFIALAVILKVSPEELWKTIADETAIKTFNKNLSQVIQKYNNDHTLQE